MLVYALVSFTLVFLILSGYDLILFSVWTTLIYSWQPVLENPLLLSLTARLSFLGGCQWPRVLLPLLVAACSQCLCTLTR